MSRSEEISVFDVIGPNMIGPSSSHTAGALRIALLASRMLTAPPASCVFTLYNSFASTGKGHGTDRALIAGLLGLAADDVRLPQAYELAAEHALETHFIQEPDHPELHPNTVDLKIKDQAGRELGVRGVSTGGGRAMITSINGVDMEYTGLYNTILISNVDQPGAVAAISNVLAEDRINIAFMRLYRERKGQLAFTLIETDEALPERVARHLAELPMVKRAIVIPAIERMEAQSRAAAEGGRG